MMKDKRKFLTVKELFLSIALFCFFVAQSYAADLDPQIEEYVKQIVIHSYLGKISDVTKQVVTSQNINIVPQIAQTAIYEVGFEAFKQSSLGEVIRDAYKDGLDAAQKAQENHSSTAEFDIKKAIDSHINPLVDDPIFHKLIETIINKTLVQQQAMMMQANAQRQIEEMVVRQKIMEEAIKRQFEAAYEQAVTQQMLQSGN